MRRNEYNIDIMLDAFGQPFEQLSMAHDDLFETIAKFGEGESSLEELGQAFEKVNNNY